jgi:hypothetical protein
VNGCVIAENTDPFFNSVTRVSQECYTRVSQECYKSEGGLGLHERHDGPGVWRVLQGCYEGVTRGVTRVLQECYKSVTRVLQECYKSVARVLQGWKVMRYTRVKTFITFLSRPGL